MLKLLHGHRCIKEAWTFLVEIRQKIQLAEVRANAFTEPADTENVWQDVHYNGLTHVCFCSNKLNKSVSLKKKKSSLPYLSISHTAAQITDNYLTKSAIPNAYNIQSSIFEQDQQLAQLKKSTEFLK